MACRGGDCPEGHVYIHARTRLFALDGQGLVYVGTSRGGGRLACFDASGRELWPRDVGSLLQTARRARRGCKEDKPHGHGR